MLISTAFVEQDLITIQKCLISSCPLDMMVSPRAYLTESSNKTVFVPSTAKHRVKTTQLEEKKMRMEDVR